MTYFLLRDYNIFPKKELHWSPWVLMLIVSCGSNYLLFSLFHFLIKGYLNQSEPSVCSFLQSNSA